MDLFIICRKKGIAEISKEYKNKTKEEAKQLVMFYLANYEGYICTCPDMAEAEKTCKQLNGGF